MSTPNWSEIKSRATAFAKEWQGEASERAEAQSFWNDFFEIFGVHRRRVATFEASVKKLNNNKGRIDCFWPSILLVEYKSAGEDLSAAYLQATDYFAGLKDEELPRFILVSDFANFRLYDLDTNTHAEFKLQDLHKNIERFSFILGRTMRTIREQDPINIKAVEKMGLLHDALKKEGYAGHKLELLLVRILFCLFADDTGIFTPRDMMLDHLLGDTKEDGRDLGMVLGKVFETLNQPYANRQKSLPAPYSAYPYVNGKLFEERIDLPDFTPQMRTLLINCCELDWSKISPAIFGAMFQKIIELDEKDRRRQMGAHYTSEENILKLIGSLFLDALKIEFEQVRHHQNQLFEFHKKLTSLKFFDPGCGCGNFLVITYRELRMLELEVFKAAQAFGSRTGFVFKAICVDVDQFSGIEIEEFPAQIAQVAMWLIDHQMNVTVGEFLGEWMPRIPLTKSANIRIGNALRLDWESLCPPSQLNYILGNPPFIGKQNQSAGQKEDMAFVTKGIKNAGVLDYVAGWYIKAAQYLTGSKIGSISRDKHQFSDAEFYKSNPPRPLEDEQGNAQLSNPNFPRPLEDEQGNAQLSNPNFPRPMGEGQGVRENIVPEYLLKFARELRTNQTDAEKLMWQMLRGKQVLDFKFRRQHPIAPYILDFYCHEAKIAIELDGGQHIENTEQDRVRDANLANQGIKVVRFWSNQVLAETEAVMERICQTLFAITANTTLSPNPSPMGRGGIEGSGIERGGIEDMFASADKLEASQRRQVKCAFVSTNSITQGEQVGVLWSYLLAQGMHIEFAHRTFQWSNEAPGKAAVHCVIIGFGFDSPHLLGDEQGNAEFYKSNSPRPLGEGLGERAGFINKQKHLFEYPNIKGQPHEIMAENINPYLVDAPDVVLPSRTNPLCLVPEMVYGSKPTDGGNLLLDAFERDALIASEPNAANWIRPFLGADEFINNIPRYCLWLKNIPPSELAKLPQIQKRVKAVREMRLASTKLPTVKLADYSTLFAEDRQPETNYLLVPSVSSERRQYVPIGYLTTETINSNANFSVPNATLYHFGMLTSTMHNAWMRQVCGRLKSDFRYSNTIVYNNFPWPSLTPTLSQGERENNSLKIAIETAAQAVLNVRAMFPNESLAVLYNPDTMPPALVKSHATLDKAVDAAYVADGGAKHYASDAERVAFLFKRYQQLTSLI